ncbi:MAG: amino acid ABC transporter substrate-binding protein, partial [Proteobacteria bacterium]|nr:amino acid ABC transporter substrate-binding protein [Pseudomonadota bacterium]
YAGLENDERHADFRGYANIVLRQAADPYDGAKTALQESQVIARALDIDLKLERLQAKDAAGIAGKISRHAKKGVQLFLLDAPGDVVAEVAKRTRDENVLLFNITALDDALRAGSCGMHLLNIAPSRSMLMDALGQYAASQRWEDVLVLRGPQERDKLQVAAFLRAAKRFGVNVVDVREFSQGNDPRERTKNNVALLTRGSYDAVFVADAALALARFVPYQTRLPRPVFGDQGLVPAAWHWAGERYGAPQLNQRFERVADRRMQANDWAAWTAVRLIMDAVRATRATDIESIAAFLRSDELNLDTYKGSPGSFRAWDNQLRQPILLHTENAVIAYAPLEGFLHPTRTLDTLGTDRVETACTLQ